MPSRHWPILPAAASLENIPRVLPKGTVAEIDLDAVPYLPVFDWLQKTGGVAEREMLRTFNCGIGMIVVVKPKDAKAVAAALKKSGEKVVTLGSIRRRKGKEEQVALPAALQSNEPKARRRFDFRARLQHGGAGEAARDPAYPAEIVCVVSNRPDAAGWNLRGPRHCHPCCRS